jgi:hypothetical protein
MSSFAIIKCFNIVEQVSACVGNDNGERQKISNELEKIRDELDVILRRGFVHEAPFSDD